MTAVAAVVVAVAAVAAAVVDTAAAVETAVDQQPQHCRPG